MAVSRHTAYLKPLKLVLSNRPPRPDPKSFLSALFILIITVAACNNPQTTSQEKKNMPHEPFSFQELRSAQRIPLPPIKTVTASDGIKLAYRAYVPKQPKAGIIFYHGGGAHSAAGYQYLGAALSARYNIATFTPDIRGHGKSGGARGDAPNSQQVLKDISSLIIHIKKRYPHLSLYLGGHSSGAGLILNYSNFTGKEDVKGYVFLAPQLGFRSKTERTDNPHPFAKVNVLPFIINRMTGGALLGHSKAVTFNYPAELLKSDAGFVGYNTVNMANALTPSSPHEQLKQLDKPLGVWIGDLDEVLDADKVVSFVKSASPGDYVEKAPGEKHLSILIKGAQYLGPWIPDYVLVNNAINDLKRAIKTRDYSKLRYDVPDEKPLSWSSYERQSDVYLSFDEMVNKLSAIAKNSNISINEIPLQIFDITIETKGWNSEYPYLYFEFTRVSYGWRWDGVYDATSRSSDFLSAAKGDLGDPSRDAELRRLISHVKQAIQSKDFKKLKTYVPDKRYYTWGICCVPGCDFSPDELSFEDLTEILRRESKGAEIYFNPKPWVEWKFKSMGIETEGWLGEYPFFTFLFELINDRWVWGGVCYSTAPELKLTEKRMYEPSYFRTPQLPRPGPRTFKDYDALKARIEEIIKFRAFDALEAYAINNTLIFEKHSRDVTYSGGEYQKLKGKKRPVREVIEFLKKNARDTDEIRCSGIHKSYYDTDGWSGKYPFIRFYIGEGKSDWEFIGVTYRKTLFY